MTLFSFPGLHPLSLSVSVASLLSLITKMLFIVALFFFLSALFFLTLSENDPQKLTPSSVSITGGLMGFCVAADDYYK